MHVRGSRSGDIWWAVPRGGSQMIFMQQTHHLPPVR